MGSFLISLLFLCSILFIFFPLIYKFFIKFQNQKITENNGKKLQLPPGSKGLPFIGEILDYLYYIFNGVPEKFIEDRKKKYSSKIFKTSLIGESMAILCGAEGNKFLFSNENKLVRVWYLPIFDKLFPNSNNKTNTNELFKLRIMFSSFLKPDALRKSVAVMDSEMKQHLISNWNSDDHKVEVSSMSKKYTAALSCKLFLSINESKTIDEFSKMIEVIASSLHSVIPQGAFHPGIKASKAIRKEIEKLIKQRRIDIGEKSSSKVPQDVITHMLMNTDENGQFLNEFDIASNLLTVLIAAYGELQNTITLVMMHLSELPDVYENVLKEQMEIAKSKKSSDLLDWEDLSRMKYTWNVACEVLRLFPPIGTFREAITDFKYCDHLIPKGWKMHWMARSTHMNPEYFPNPNKFDPTRFEGNGPAPYTFVPFGGGPRMCPGIEYTRLVILVFISNVVTKFKWKKLIPSEKIRHGTFTTPRCGLPIHLDPFKP